MHATRANIYTSTIATIRRQSDTHRNEIAGISFYTLTTHLITLNGEEDGKPGGKT